MFGATATTATRRMAATAATTVTARGPSNAGSAIAAAAKGRRTAVNLAALKGRIKATANVAKLTSVMKLVASSKLRNAERDLAAARPFGLALMQSIALDDDAMEALFARNEESSAPSDKKVKQLVVVLTTDRGLCGSVNSTIARAMPSYVREQNAKGFDPSFFILGEKGRAQIAAQFTGSTVASIDNAFDKEPIFPLAAALGEKIVSEKFDVLTFMYNRFDSSAKFTTLRKHVPQIAGLGVGIMPQKFQGYSVEPENNEETLVNMMEFAVAGSLYYALLETKACEISQRVTAMDNASTNASDMVDRFTLLYNRARQAKITTELTEIISGAESIADGE